MRVREHVAPSYGELRPFKHRRTETFPVYHHLVDTLVSASNHPEETIAHVMAVCSAYAYSEVETVATMMSRIGLEKNHCVMIDEYVDAMLITSTAFLVQSEDGRVVILCYRGTPPTSVVTWLTDANLDPTPIKVPSPSGSGGPYDVHGGIYRNVRSTRYLILEALKRALDGRSVVSRGLKLRHGLEALYITGHSLGAASAAMLALLLVVDPDYHEDVLSKLKLQAVYTFGAPMIASPELASECDKHEFLRDRVIRYVHANDIGPQLPPRASGPFKHFGAGYQYTRRKDRTWEHDVAPNKQLRNPLRILTAPLTLFATDFKLTRPITFRASVRDHMPQYYIDMLKPGGVHSEFGDPPAVDA